MSFLLPRPRLLLAAGFVLFTFSPLDAQTFDAMMERPVSAISNRYLTGWKQHVQFTGYSVDFLKKVKQSHPDMPIGELGGRPFSDKTALSAWLARMANPPR